VVVVIFILLATESASQSRAAREQVQGAQRESDEEQSAQHKREGAHTRRLICMLPLLGGTMLAAPRSARG